MIERQVTQIRGEKNVKITPKRQELFGVFPYNLVENVTNPKSVKFVTQGWQITFFFLPHLVTKQSMSVTIRKALRVRFVDPTNNTTTQITNEEVQTQKLFKKISEHLNRQHHQLKEGIPTTCAKWITQHIVADADFSKKYYKRDTDNLWRQIKFRVIINQTIHTITNEHHAALEVLQCRLKKGLEAKNAKIALVCDLTCFASQRAAELHKEFKVHVEEVIREHIMDALNNHCPKIHLDSCKDCVIIGDSLYRVASTATLQKLNNTEGHNHTARLPWTFLATKTINTAKSLTPIQVLLGSALLCNRVPENLIVNSSDTSVIEAFTSVGGDLVAHIPVPVNGSGSQ